MPIHQLSERKRGRRERRLVQTGAEDFGLPTTRGFQSGEKRPGLSDSVSLRGVTFEGDLDPLGGDKKHGLGSPFLDQRLGGDSDAREVLEEGSLLRQILQLGSLGPCRFNATSSLIGKVAWWSSGSVGLLPS
jgi:hypothetical protein